MRVMTFNLRFENDRDGKNAWHFRRKPVVDLVQEHAPSILGTQEGTPGQLDYLRDHLPGYRIHAPDRCLDATCQYPTLFCLKDRFVVKEGGELWLSETPLVHRSKNWDSAFPRMMSYALLEDLEVNRHMWVVVTHLDHIGVEARREQAAKIVQWIGRRRAEPLILMGDFNDTPGSVVHRILTAPEAGLEDTWQTLGRLEGEDSMTHHGFHGVPRNGRIDWILVSRRFRALDALIIRDHTEGRYPSDHFPYMVELDWV